MGRARWWFAGHGPVALARTAGPYGGRVREQPFREGLLPRPEGLGQVQVPGRQLPNTPRPDALRGSLAAATPVSAAAVADEEDADDGEDVEDDAKERESGAAADIGLRTLVTWVNVA